MFLLFPTSSVRIISFLHESRVYQAGTAEYAQVQAARLRQLHNGLEGGNQKQRRGHKQKTLADEMNETLRRLSS